MWDCKYNNRTVQERWDAMTGKHCDGFFFIVRCGVLVFALHTMSMVGTEVYIAPHYWLIAFVYWYWIS
jgi:hypothetical protein